MDILELQPCKGCKRLFVPESPLQQYHSVTCVKNTQRKKRTERKRKEANQIVTEKYNQYVDSIIRLKPKGAKGYRLYSPELQITLPIPDTARRDGSKPLNCNFTLDPVEIPISPLAAFYDLIWVFSDGTALRSNQRAFLAWEDDCTRKKRLHDVLAAYRARLAASNQRTEPPTQPSSEESEESD